MNIENKKVVIIGGKRSGMALARLVTSLNGKAAVSEQGAEDCLSDEFKEWALEQGVTFEVNGHTKGFIENSDLVVLSPGVRIDAQPVQWAKDAGILVLGEIEFAAQFCNTPIIAVTGSNGKTTVSTLIRDVLSDDGKKVCLCGNIGFPFSQYVLDLEDKDYIVLEISSFQLESLLDFGSQLRNDPDFHIKGFKPHIAVILNFSQNHLDRHKDLREYFDAKKRIFLNQGVDDFAVLNASYPELKELEPDLRSHAIYFDSEQSINPNYLAVIEVARILGIKKEYCQVVFQKFKGVEHRLEKVRNLKGIDFVNDSKATTVEAGKWALNSINQPVVMICGGRDKNVDFSVLTESVQKKVKKIYTIGEARQKIRQSFGSITELEECDRLEEAVMKARGTAIEGDCVLLSPMCASFDMFDDFEHRGRAFKNIVNRLV